MGRNISYPNQIGKLIIELSSKCPSVNIGKHIDTIISDYGNLEWLSDKELYVALVEYIEKLDQAGSIPAILGDAETSELLEDGTHLFDLAENEPEL